MGEQAAIGRWVGLLLLALLVAYMVISVRWSQRHPAGEPFQLHDEREVAERAHAPVAKLVLLGLVGLAMVLLASRSLIVSVTELAEVHWHVPKVVIAATLVALGTSLPELVIGLTSIAKGHHELLVGNVIGADILNVLFVVGASAAAAPLPLLEHGTPLPGVMLYVHLPTMILVLVLFRLFIFSAAGPGRFRRWYGAPLVALYLAYVVIQLLITRP